MRVETLPRINPQEFTNQRSLMDALSLNTYLVKEHVGMFKAASNFDIYDPATGQIVIQCREENLGFFTKMLRFTDYKRATPFEIMLRDNAGNLLITVKRGVSLLRSTVQVLDGDGTLLGMFRQKLLSVGGSFQVLGPHEELLCELKGKWTGWDFSFGLGGEEFGRVTKKWSGLGKEMFTSADNYALQISEDLGPESPLRKLILGAVMCIDFVLKE